MDNILRPILVGRDTKLPDYVVLFSTLGGLAMFGITGFAVGPLLAALFVAFWGIFIREFNEDGVAAAAGWNSRRNAPGVRNRDFSAHGTGGVSPDCQRLAVMKTKMASFWRQHPAVFSQPVDAEHRW